MKKFLFWILLQLSTQVFADEQALQMQRAAAYLEVGQFSQARSIYQSDLQETTIPWQRAILLYNLGIVLAKEQNWEQAMQTFDAVFYDHSLGPLLKYRVAYNKMITQINAALTMKEQNPDESLKRLLKANQELENLQLTACQLQKVLGDPSCNKIPEIAGMHQFLEIASAQVRQKSEEFRLQKFALIEGINLLIKGLEQASLDIENLSLLPADHSLRKSYQILYLKELTVMEPIWKGMQILIETHPQDPQINKRLKLFRDADVGFRKTVQNLKEDQVAASQQSLQMVLLDLKKLAEIPPPPAASPIEDEAQPEQRLPSSSQATVPNKKESSVEQALFQMHLEDQLPVPSIESSHDQELRPW